MTNETVTKSARFYCVSLTPDICKTPVGSSTPPLPYTIIGEFSGAQNASPNVKSHSEPVILHQRSIIPSVTGDAPGKAGGIKSGTVGKQVDTKVASPIHHANGADLVQVGREVWMNARNTVGKIYERGGEAARPVLTALSQKVQELAQDYKDHGSKKMHGAADDMVEVGGTILTGSAVVGVAGATVAATGVGLPAAAAMETAAATGAVVGGATVAGGTAVEASATVLDQAADYVLTGKTPDVVNTAVNIATNTAETLVLKAMLNRIPGGSLLGKFFGKKVSSANKTIKEKLAGKKPVKQPPKLDKPPPKNGGDDGKSRGKKEPKSEAPSDCCPKNSGPGNKPAKSRKPVHFGTGQEIMYQTDFALEGAIPIVWTRCYRSGAECEDWGPLGARWATPYTTALSLCDAGIVYHDDSGRALRLPLLAVGQQYDSRKEGFVLARDGADTFTLLWRNGSLDRFTRGADGWLPHGYNGVNAMLAPSAPLKTERFELVRSEGRDGRGVSIEHFRAAKAGAVLLRLCTDDETMVEALRLDDSVPARIGSIEEVLRDGSRVRHVRYRYAAGANEAATHFDLASQENALGDARHYTYRHHLLRACSSYAGFAHELEWISLDALRARWGGSHLSDRELLEAYPITAGNSYQARATATRAGDGSELTQIAYLDNDTSRVTENGSTHDYVFDANWLITEVRRIDHGQAVTLGRREWDRDGMLLADIDANGAATRYAYDAAGNLLSSTDALGNRSTIAYDESNQPVLFTDALGNITRREYDDAGRSVSISDALGHVTQYRYNQRGQVSELIDAKGGSKQFRYNRQGLLTSFTDCSGHTSDYAYDKQGRLISTNDAMGHATTYDYDALGRLIRLASPGGAAEQYRYDADGNLVLHTDAAGHQTRYRYNGQGLPIERKDAMGQALRYRYDDALQLTELINSKGESYRLSYHAEGWLETETGFDGKHTEYIYDRAGNLTAFQSGTQRTELLRNALGLLQAKTTAEGVVRYAYNALGRLVAVSSPQAEQRFFHDALGQLTEERSAYYLQSLPDIGRLPNAPRTPDASFVMTHAYDELGNRIQTILPNGRRIDTLRYGSGHWHGVLWQGQTVVDVERDSLHREKQRTLGNSGLIATRQYDAQSRLTQMTLARGMDNPSPLRERRFHYDASGNLTTIAQTGQTANGPLGNLQYTYDPLGQLLSAVQPGLVERFAFDPAGNMIDATPAAGAQLPAITGNLLRTYGDFSYDYDEQGNTTRKHFHPPGRESTWSDLKLEYDAENRISHATRTQRQTRHRAQYFYDAFSRRIAKRVELEQWGNQQDIATDQPVQTSSTTTLFVWDGDTLAQELGQDETVTYLYEPESFVPLARIRSEGIDMKDGQSIHLSNVNAWDFPITIKNFDKQKLIAKIQAKDCALYQTSWQKIQSDATDLSKQNWIDRYNCDQLGTPREMTDALGKVVWSARYKAWGILHATDIENSHQAIRFQGQYEDDETGLAYNRYRYYDAHIGRYLTKDPIGLLGGLNTYRYATNPVDWVDPLGLSKKCSKNTSCDPCIGKNPAAWARQWQGHGIYKGRDTWTNTVLKANTIIYGGLPGQSGFYFDDSTLQKSANSKSKLGELLQILPHRQFGYRPDVQAYRVKKDTCVATSIASAQDTKIFGQGGGQQFFLSDFKTKIVKIGPKIRMK
ncbi:RHS repeat-associated core domain-containing protein [Janthinobacterium sp. RB2R34]|uniref:RHS repeat-associated core domain-containing protein n=1 Tax=Janthinobacterium sp. RB2R34 TaxID=3424193 RepID=UPI003F2368BB